MRAPGASGLQALWRMGPHVRPARRRPWTPLGTVHRFGEDRAYENRAIVVYSGIHYDAITLKEGSEETTVFPNLTALGIPEAEDEVLSAAKELCRELKRRRYYTDTASFSLKCKQCGKGLTGEKEGYVSERGQLAADAALVAAAHSE